MNSRLVTVLLASATGLSACCEPGLCSDPSLDVDAGPAMSGDGGATLSAIQAAVFTPSCATAACHVTANVMNPALGAGLDLSSTSTSFATLVSQPTTFPNTMEMRVDPGHPESSFLVVKLSAAIWSSSYPMTGGPEMTGPDGLAMPFGGTGPIPAAQFQLIVDWIAAGAPNN